MARRRVHVLLLNMGGPDTLADVRPFLFNLFSDPDLIPIPWWLRWLRVPLAWLIAKFRAPKSAENYARIGGGSPQKKYAAAVAQGVLPHLQKAHPDITWSTGIAMRFWHPMHDAVCRELNAAGFDEIVLVPLYPQYSVTTVRSSLKDFYRAARKVGLKTPLRTLNYWYTDDAYVLSSAEALRATLAQVPSEAGPPIILYSAHSIPMDRVQAGDPYPQQINDSLARIQRAAGLQPGDAALAYQSRVGPVEWQGPSVDATLERLAREAPGRPLVIYPMSFVSDHIETLEEIDIGYRERAHELGLGGFYRVPVFNDRPEFIARFATMIGHFSTTPAGSYVCQTGSGTRCQCDPHLAGVCSAHPH